MTHVTACRRQGRGSREWILPVAVNQVTYRCGAAGGPLVAKVGMTRVWRHSVYLELGMKLEG